MGSGYSFRCKNCGKKYNSYKGVGMLFPKVYADLVKAVCKGEYGTEWRNAMMNDYSVAIDAEKKIYVCDKCGSWQAEPDMSLYALNNQPEGDYSRDSIESIEWDEYVMPYMLRKDPDSLWDKEPEYHLLKRYEHECCKCGGIMHKATEEEEENLACPECGPINEPETMLMWD